MADNNFEELFDEGLIDLDVNVLDKEEFFNVKASKLIEKEYVKESYKEAVIERESKYPTGLALEKIAIAIPHTDTKHIKKPFVYINRLDEEIEFNQMGDEDKVIKVSDVWMLGIKDGSKQVDLLSFIMDIFNDSAFIEEYEKIDNPNELINLIKKNIKNGGN